MKHRIIARNAAAAAAAVILAVPVAWANDDEALPAQQVIAAIQLAVQARPGLVKEVEVDRDDGRLWVKVETVAQDGQEREVRVDPQSGQVVTAGQRRQPPTSR